MYGTKGDKGDPGTNGTNGTTPTIAVAKGTNFGTAGTPNVTMSQSGTKYTFTFDYMKGAKGDKGDKGDKGSDATVTIIDNLWSTSTTAALSANQGKLLNDSIGTLFTE